MPIIPVTVGPFQAVYVGNAGQSAKLTKVFNLRQNGTNVKETLPTEWNQLTKNSDQAGNHSYIVTLNFMSGGDMPVRLGRGLAITDDINSPIGSNLYSLLLLHNNENIRESWYFPIIRTEKILDKSYLKTSPTGIPLNFLVEDFDSTLELAYQDTAAALATVMGSQSPY